MFLQYVTCTFLYLNPLSIFEPLLSLIIVILTPDFQSICCSFLLNPLPISKFDIWLPAPYILLVSTLIHVDSFLSLGITPNTVLSMVICAILSRFSVNFVQFQDFAPIRHWLYTSHLRLIGVLIFSTSNGMELKTAIFSIELNAFSRRLHKVICCILELFLKSWFIVCAWSIIEYSNINESCLHGRFSLFVSLWVFLWRVYACWIVE